MRDSYKSIVKEIKITGMERGKKMEGNERAKSLARQISPPQPIGSYSPEDCTFLLKNINGLVKEMGTKEREEHVQKGGHYSEVLPV